VTTPGAPDIEGPRRQLAPQVLGALARRHGQFEACEDATQEALLAAVEPGERHEPAPGEPRPPQHDDTLTLLFLCCHPALMPASQIALTLRAVGGLTTAEIASAFLVPEATMAQRISRAKQTIKAGGMQFELPLPDQRAERRRTNRSRRSADPARGPRPLAMRAPGDRTRAQAR
jgi:predicted RNA polymerase sigma factor